MLEIELSEATKKYNILDMALTFTAMMRLFMKGSKERIALKLEETSFRVNEITSVEDFERMHKTFCEWFCREIYTAEKELKNKKIKPGHAASYGQAAKVLDVVLKVYVFYCSQPSSDVASRICPFLHSAVDTLILSHLKQKYSEVQIEATTIEQVSEQIYWVLQRLVARDIHDSFRDNVLPVQYDDIMWHRLNRKTEAHA